MMKNDIIFIKKTEIPLDKIKCQYIPHIFSSEFWPGKDPMAICGSPHVCFLKQYLEIGKKWDILLKSEYARLFRFWNSINYTVNGKKRTKSYILDKMKKFIKLYENINKFGYNKKSRIEVLAHPFWMTRYNIKEDFLFGYEIWHGHHRAACCFVLGVRKVMCNLYEDARPGKLKCNKWDSRLKYITRSNL